MKALNRHSMETENDRTRNLGGKKMKAKELILGLVALSVLSFAAFATAGVPQMINYQGVLTDPDGCPEDGDFFMTFCIYDDSSDGIMHWEDTATVGVTQGNFNVLLGTTYPIPSSLFLNPELWLEVQVETDTMVPRQRIGSVGYAFHAEYAEVGADEDWVIEGDTIYHLDGPVGIGTTNPAQELDVAGIIAVNGISVLTQGDSSISVGNLAGIDPPQSLGLFTNDVERIRIETSGKVGIGTANPLAPLHVKTTALHTDTGGTFKVEADQPTPDLARIVAHSHRNDNSFVVASFEGHGGNSAEAQVSYADILFGIEDNAASSEKGFINLRTTNGGVLNLSSRMYIDGDGNVALGTTSPSSKLHVFDSSTVDIEVEHEGGAVTVLESGPSYGKLGTITDDRLLLQTGGESRVVVNGTTGDVCIGDPCVVGYKLYVAGNARTGDLRTADLDVRGTLKLTYDYDTTFSISAGSDVTVTHGLGGDEEKYFVFLYGKNSYGIHQMNYGTACQRINLVDRWFGCAWYKLTNNTITVRRAADDNNTDWVPVSKQWDQVILRMLKNQ